MLWGVANVRGAAPQVQGASEVHAWRLTSFNCLSLILKSDPSFKRHLRADFEERSAEIKPRFTPRF